MDSQEEFDEPGSGRACRHAGRLQGAFYQARTQPARTGPGGVARHEPDLPARGGRRLRVLAAAVAAVRPLHQEAAVRRARLSRQTGSGAAGTDPVQRGGAEARDDGEAAERPAAPGGDLRGRPDRRHQGQHATRDPGVPGHVGIRAGRVAPAANPVAQLAGGFRGRCWHAAVRRRSGPERRSPSIRTGDGRRRAP